MARWLHSSTCRPPELPVYDIHTYKHQIYPGKLRLLSIRHMFSAQSAFTSAGELDKNSAINFKTTKEEKLILTVLLMY